MFSVLAFAVSSEEDLPLYFFSTFIFLFDIYPAQKCVLHAQASRRSFPVLYVPIRGLKIRRYSHTSTTQQHKKRKRMTPDTKQTNPRTVNGWAVPVVPEERCSEYAHKGKEEEQEQKVALRRQTPQCSVCTSQQKNGKSGCTHPFKN